jgi:hypothetical protein
MLTYCSSGTDITYFLKDSKIKVRNVLSRGSGRLVNVVPDYRRRTAFHLRQRQWMFPLASLSRQSLTGTQPPVQWVPGVHARG